MKQLQEQEIEKKRLALEPPPPKPMTNSNWVIKKYYDDNKDAILRDIEVLGYSKTEAKWCFKWGTWLRMQERWNLPPAPRKSRRAKAPLQEAISPKPPQAASVSKKEPPVASAESPIPVLTLKLTIYVHPSGAVKVVAG